MTAILSGNGDVQVLLDGLLEVTSSTVQVDIAGADGSGGVFPPFIGIRIGDARQRTYIDGVENLRELRNALDHILTRSDRVEHELRGL